MIKLLTLILVLVPQLIPAPAEMQVRGGSFKVDGEKRMEFVLDASADIPQEGYTLEVTRTRVRAVASTEAGLFYARQTLRQLEENGKIPCVKIKDYPRFAWRGFHVDPCRHFLSVEETKKYIDILASYKMNVMHWHLTDDQGWRIQIKRYPRLTEVGGTRTEFDGSVHEGYYTQEEIREVVAYAAQRHVTVVPEIEMPGHAMAAIRAYPGLSCTKETINTFYTWGSPDVVFCPGTEYMFQFLEDVVQEVVELFPSEYFHVGGDECKKDKWEKCPHCQARIKALGLVADKAGTAEEKLQSYAIRRMEDILHKYGRKLIGWDEILEGGLSPNATVMSWRGESGGIAAALEGHDVIMTPGKEGMYLDHVQGDPKIEPVSIGNYTTLEKAYGYDPVPAQLTENGKDSHVIGLQCNTWSEYIYSDAQREYMMFPRAFAVAETGWTPKEKKDWESFRVRVDKACQDLDRRGVNYHIPLPEQPGGSCDRLAFIDKAEVAFTTTRPVTAMVYTLDGSEPTPASARYTQPLVFTQDATLKIASLTSYGKLSPVRTITLRKEEPAEAMPAAAVESGLHARRADGRFLCTRDLEGAQWQEVKLAKLRDMNTLEPFDRNMPDSLRFYAVQADGIFMVNETAVYRFSSDCDEVWVDGRLLIDNNGEVKRYSRHDAEAALEAGPHSVKVVYLYNVIGGWNSLRNRTEVQIRKAGTEKWRKIEIL
ncbi:MAG: family 20 glycosylhydrolase [Bacteroidales bacterium]|nr:family 20 glycosylhydrolase [Bacteroidales bacterium]